MNLVLTITASLVLIILPSIGINVLSYPMPFLSIKETRTSILIATRMLIVTFYLCLFPLPKVSFAFTITITLVPTITFYLIPRLLLIALPLIFTTSITLILNLHFC